MAIPPANHVNSLVISVKEARKLLGIQSKAMSDSEIIQLVEDMQIFARQQFGSHGRGSDE